MTRRLRKALALIGPGAGYLFASHFLRRALLCHFSALVTLAVNPSSLLPPIYAGRPSEDLEIQGREQGDSRYV